MYILQFIGQLQIGAIYSVYGTMWISTIILICGQFDLLFCSIKNMLYSAMLLRGDSRSKECFKSLWKDDSWLKTNKIEYYKSIEEWDEISSQAMTLKNGSLLSDGKYDKELLRILRETILLHQNILRISGLLEEFFSPFMLAKTSVCCILACFIAYLTSSGLTSVMKVITLLEYLFLVFAELLLNTYYPTLLQQHVSFVHLSV